MRPIVGVDFSGAEDAGSYIWLTEARLDGGVLHVESVQPASELPGGSPERGPALQALARFLAQRPRAAVGLDAPFSLPAGLVEEKTWEAFVTGFKARFPDAEALRQACQEAADGELRRATDQEALAPFSPYNLRMYKQTYHVIADVLAPLVRDGEACVLPFQEPDPHRPWLLEVCPASTLRAEGLSEGPPYKGPGPDRRSQRLRLLSSLETKHAISLASRRMRSRYLENTGGDALDSLIAAHAVARNLADPRRLRARPEGPQALEGRIYL